jgi:hypothetical protein
MPRVTEKYHLPPPVPFVDVRVEQDNRLFIEPSAIRFAARLGDPYAAAADQIIKSFFDEVLISVRGSNLARGMYLMGNLHEPNETRLGMTAVGVAGHGMGPKLANDLWIEMHGNPACQTAVLVHRIEHLALYVEGVGPDLISDLTTRIAFGVLIDFTSEMMRLYPSLAAHTSTKIEQVWDIHTASWLPRSATLPDIDGDRLLLVPVNWVWSRQLLNAPSFYQVQALGRIQDELTQPAKRPGDRPLAPTKNTIRRAHPKVRPTNISQAVAAAEKDGVSLTDRHANYVLGRYKSNQMSAEEINNLL